MNKYSQNYLLRKLVYIWTYYLTSAKKSLPTMIYLVCFDTWNTENSPNIIDALKKILLNWFVSQNFIKNPFSLCYFILPIIKNKNLPTAQIFPNISNGWELP